MMTALSYYGLSFNPFDKQQVKEKDRFLSQDLQEMLNRLDYLKDTRGIGVFTAGPGMGKSFALRCFSKALNPNLYHMEYICLSTVSVMEFYRQFCQILGVEAKGGKPGMFDAIQAQICVSWQTHGRYERSIIDYESGQVVYRPKMLMNYRYDSVNCFTLILCGEPYLNNTLRKPVHEALRQRITVHYTFSGLSDAEVAEYVRHKLVCAGGAETIIEPSALSALHSHSQGNPRIVDNLMSDALLLGAQMDKKAIDPDTILAAVSGRNLV